MSVLTDQTFVRLLDNRLRQVEERKFAELKSRIPTFFSMAGSDSAWEEFMDIGAYPDIPEFTGRLAYQAVWPGFYKRIEHKEFASGMQVERKLLDDKKYAVLDSKAEAMLEAAMRTKEKYGARAFNYSFSSSQDFMVEHEEGTALCSNSHTTRTPDISTTTTPTGGFDNLGTAALSDTNLTAAYLAAINFRNDIGELIEFPDTWTVVCPQNLNQTAWEIIKTPRGYETPNMTENWHFGKYGLESWMRLDAYDTNNWWLVNTTMMKRFLVWYDRIKPETASTVDFDHMLYKYRIYMRFSYGWTDWRWVYGSQVS